MATGYGHEGDELTSGRILFGLCHLLLEVEAIISHLGAIMRDEIQALFRLRDESVRNKDVAQFLSTQLHELPSGLSESYLSVDGMTSKILYFHEASETGIAVLVEEIYTSSGKLQNSPRSSLLIYFLVDTKAGWKIYKSR